LGKGIQIVQNIDETSDFRLAENVIIFTLKLLGAPKKLDEGQKSMKKHLILIFVEITKQDSLFVSF